MTDKQRASGITPEVLFFFFLSLIAEALSLITEALSLIAEALSLRAINQFSNSPSKASNSSSLSRAIISPDLQTIKTKVGMPESA